ncbi:lysine exporter LysO family protein [Marinobacteraceae bacterium S3BR75-40.1]
MYSGMILILLPLFAGYLIPLSSARLRQGVHHAVNGLVYVILGLLGIGLGELDNLAAKLTQVGWQVGALVVITGVFNLAGLWLWARWKPIESVRPSGSSGVSWRMLTDAGQTFLAVGIGVVIGLMGWQWGEQAADVAEYALMLLLLLVGCQLRNAGIALRRVIFNRQGLGIALTVVMTSMLAGFLLIPWLELSWGGVMALVSGFGWYSLSAVVIGDALGPLWGSAAFLNDMTREIIGLATIPLLMRLKPALAIGYGGATAMDFTLPVIQRSGGVAMVPLAMASGFILSLLGPVLMAFFLGFAG